MARNSKCTRLSRILRTIEHAKKRRLSKAERKKGRRVAVRKAIEEINSRGPAEFISKSEFDARRQQAQPGKSIRELADEMYREDHGSG